MFNAISLKVAQEQKSGSKSLRCVFMVVALNGSWKIPIAYFFVDAMSDVERANLLNVCVKKLHDVGAVVISVTCDGPSCHFCMLYALGGCLNPNNLRPSFLNP